MGAQQKIIELLKKYKFSPQKRFGQNFLISDHAIENLCQALELSKNDIVLEIGGGLGYLTSLLAQQVKWVIALEFDYKLYAILQRELSRFDNVTLIQTDAARCDYKQIINQFPESTHKIKVIGNLPYNVAIPIFIRMETIIPHIQLIISTLQKEMSERVRALPGGKEYSDLSIRMQYFYQIKKIHSLYAKAFYPKPKIDSEIISLLPLEAPPVKVSDVNFFFKLTRAAFSQRRKTVINVLRGHQELGISKDQWPLVFEKVNISPSRRSETLSIAEFAKLANLIRQPSNI